ncbi:hypothetical protein [Actinopolymorpha rutila]|uniref:Uncharacterized protein n=1 Tax=Actinopolymorpha rutila TaxID=446787 RepID=A0A852ZCN7_9ACTN|nr:hypothetical protein [Actinopolymorpha rutila]NYH89552.1 hypothetical protein [Actinopolymorpha rutila]
MDTSSPPDGEDVLRAQRRRAVLRQVRARQASAVARRSAIARTAVLLRSANYHER